MQLDDCSPIKQGDGGEVKVSPFMLSPIDLKSIVIPEISNFAVLENSMVIESPCSTRSHRRVSSGSFVTTSAMAGLNESELAAVKDMYEELVQIQESSPTTRAETRHTLTTSGQRESQSPNSKLRRLEHWDCELDFYQGPTDNEEANEYFLKDGPMNLNDSREHDFEGFEEVLEVTSP